MNNIPLHLINSTATTVTATDSRTTTMLAESVAASTPVNLEKGNYAQQFSCTLHLPFSLFCVGSIFLGGSETFEKQPALVNK